MPQIETMQIANRTDLTRGASSIAAPKMKLPSTHMVMRSGWYLRSFFTRGAMRGRGRRAATPPAWLGDWTSQGRVTEQTKETKEKMNNGRLPIRPRSPKGSPVLGSLGAS